MVIHPHKTKCMVLTTRQKHQRRPLTLNLTLGKTPVQQVREHRVLGVIIDEELKWQSHIDNMCKHVSKNLFLLSQLRHYVDSDARKIFFPNPPALAYKLRLYCLEWCQWGSSKEAQLPSQTSSKINPTRSVLVNYGKIKETKYSSTR